MIEAIAKNIRIRYEDEDYTERKCTVSTTLCHGPVIHLRITFMDLDLPMFFLICHTNYESWLINLSGNSIVNLCNHYDYKKLLKELRSFELEDSQTECLAHAVQMIMDDRWFNDSDLPESFLQAPFNEVDEKKLPF